MLSYITAGTFGFDHRHHWRNMDNNLASLRLRGSPGTHIGIIWRHLLRSASHNSRSIPFQFQSSRPHHCHFYLLCRSGNLRRCRLFDWHRLAWAGHIRAIFPQAFGNYTPLASWFCSYIFSSAFITFAAFISINRATRSLYSIPWILHAAELIQQIPPAQQFDTIEHNNTASKYDLLAG